MLYELQGLNLKLCIKQYNENFVLPLIVAPQLSSGWQHKYSTKTRPAGRTNEQSMYSLMSMQHPLNKGSFALAQNVFDSNATSSFLGQHYTNLNHLLVLHHSAQPIRVE